MHMGTHFSRMDTKKWHCWIIKNAWVLFFFIVVVFKSLLFLSFFLFVGEED